MENYKRLFVAIDFSPSSDEALREAHLRASSTGAKLAVCHVVPNELRDNPWFPQNTALAALQFPLEMKTIGEAAVARVTEITGRADGEYELILEDGTPHAAILNRAEEWHTDLLILGSHGQTGGTDFIGSVTDSSIRHAHCAVLVVRQRSEIKNIVAATDFSDASLPALEAGAAEAARTGAALTAVHSLNLVWSALAYPAMAFGGAPFDVSPEEVASLNLEATTRLEEALKQLGANGEAVVTTGSAGTAILEVAAERNADLIVVGTVGRTGLRRALLGSVAEAVVNEAKCSVLVVRQHPK